MCKSLNVAVNKRINWCFVHLSRSDQGFWFCGGRILGFPIRKRSRR